VRRSATQALSQIELGAKTRDRLLDVGERLFARHGFAATSVRQITQDAQCNVAAVNYHFGGKFNLYREVFRRRLAVLREQRVTSIREAMKPASGPRALERVLTAFANAFLEPLLHESHGRDLIALWSREMLDPVLPPDMVASEIMRPVQHMLTDAIARFTTGVTPEEARLCALAVIAQLVQLAQRWQRAEAEGTRREDVRPLAAVVDHLVRFSAAGARACRVTARGRTSLLAAATDGRRR
jgi:AcrR family transcriptional regulator